MTPHPHTVALATIELPCSFEGGFCRFCDGRSVMHPYQSQHGWSSSTTITNHADDCPWVEARELCDKPVNVAPNALNPEDEDRQIAMLLLTMTTEDLGLYE